MSITSRSEVLSIYRGLLREVSKQYTRRNSNRIWQKEVVVRFRAGVATSEPAAVARQLQDARNLLAFMRSNRTHKELMERYWPTSGLSNEEKLTRTANTVGLSLPKILGGGQPFEPQENDASEDSRLEPNVQEALNIVKNAPS